LNNLGYFINHDFLKPIEELNLSWDVWLNPFALGRAVKLTSGKYTSIIMPMIENNEHNGIINTALNLLDKTLSSVSTEKKVLFEDTIHRRKEPLFEI
jgi:hypothetical protein